MRVHKAVRWQKRTGMEVNLAGLPGMINAVDEMGFLPESRIEEDREELRELTKDLESR